MSRNRVNGSRGRICKGIIKCQGTESSLVKESFNCHKYVKCEESHLPKCFAFDSLYRCRSRRMCTSKCQGFAPHSDWASRGLTIAQLTRRFAFFVLNMGMSNPNKLTMISTRFSSREIVLNFPFRLQSA